MRMITLLFAWLSLSASALSQNLVAYYPFNGNANDESGNNINATYTGSGVTLTTDRFGNANKAYYFDGAAGSYIRVPADNFPTTDRTISFWFNADQLGYYVPTPFSYGGNVGCNNSLLMFINHYNYTNSYLVEAHCAANVITAPYVTEPVNNWFHLTLTINGSTQKLFVNGILQQSTNSFTSPTYVTGTSALLGACVNTDGITAWDGFFQGKLDEFRIYEDAMTDAQVMQLHNLESTGMVAYYPLNGNADDLSGNGYNGTISGATLTSDRFDQPGKAYNFVYNGVSSDKIQVPGTSALNFNTGGFALSAWVQFSGTAGAGNNYPIVSKHNCGEQSGYILMLYNDKITFWLAGAGEYNYISTPDNYTDGNWHHVAAVYNGTNRFIYMDGVLKTTDVFAYTIPNNANIALGGYNGCNGGFNGKVDDIRIYNRALSPNEILQLADVPMQPNLLVYLPMNGNANDMSGNGHDGIVSSASLTTDRYNSDNSAYWFSQWYSNIPIANSTGFHFNVSGFTFSTWIKYNSGGGVIIAKHDCGYPNGYVFGINSNQLTLSLANGGNWATITTAESFINDKWYFVTAVYDGIGQASIYVDGSLKASSAAVYNDINGAPVMISGAIGNCGVANYHGSIDEVKIYAVPLSAAQIMALYKESRGSGNAVTFLPNHANHIDIGLLDAPPEFSVEAWVRRNGTGSPQYIFSGTDDNSWGVGFSDNRLMMEKLTVGNVLSNPVNVNDNKWHHIAFTFKNNNVNFYFDGISAGSGSISSAGAIASNYSIGSRSSFGNSFDGSIDEVRVWGIELTQDEIRDWMNRKVTPAHPEYANMARYYNFDETNIDQTYDLAGGVTGIIMNGPAFVISGAAIGDSSVHNFISPSSKSVTLTLPTGENFRAVETIGGSMLGISVYVVMDPPNSLTGTLGVGANDHYFGVHVSSSGATPQYVAIYNYTGNTFVSSATEPTLQMFKRANSSETPWSNSGAALNTTANTLTVIGQHTEYILGSSGFGLPVTSLNLQARKTNTTTAQLNWQTTTEINNKGFEIQRSFDGNYYVDVQFVNGAGNSNDTREYSVTDIPGRTGRVFYRLKQVDFDNNSRLSNVVSVLFDKQGMIKLYPNPAQQQVTVEGIENYKRLQVLDASGKLLKDMNTNGQYQVSINLNGLKSGVYLLRMINDNESQTVKLIISN